MNDMIDFVEFLLPEMANFLMSEPMVYFVAVMILLWVVFLVRRIIN